MRIATTTLVSILASATLSAGSYISPTSVLGGPAIDFEGFSDGTLIGAGVYAGVTFGQPDGGRPQIDNQPFLFGYVQNSGVAVLTGSTEGGAPFPTVAGLTATFDAPVYAVEAFMSDWAPLGDYSAAIFGAGGALLDSVIIPANAFPTAQTPGSGLYIGFSLPTADILSVQFGPSGANGDAFGIDDLRFRTGVPTPDGGSTLVFLSVGALGFVALRRRHSR